MKIIGIDPGTATTGYGVIETPFLISSKSINSKEINPVRKGGALTPAALSKKEGGLPTSSPLNGVKNFSCLGYGVIKTKSSLAPAERLFILNKELNKLINKYQPEALAVENVYFFKNLKTVIPVSQAKGVILLTAAKKRIPVFEFTPLQVKMTVTGYGRAEKRQVQEMIKFLLRLNEIPSPDDAADALGVAICCALGIK
jgi:crossover junction endodeoxyribonuclease RuvC